MNISNELALYYGTRLLPSLVIGAVVAVFMYFFVSIAAFFIAAAIGVCAMFVTAIIFLARTINNQPQVVALPTGPLVLSAGVGKNAKAASEEAKATDVTAPPDPTIVSSAVGEEKPKAQPAPDNPLLAFMARHRGIVDPQPQQEGGAQAYYPPGWDINQYNGTNAQ